MNIRFEKPCVHLQPYIACYWSWESGESNGDSLYLPKVAPSVDTELVVYYETSFSTINSKGVCNRLPQSHVVFLRDEALTLTLPEGGKVGFIAVRFHAGSFRHFCSMSPSELSGPFPSLAEVWGSTGVELEARIIEGTCFAERIQVIESFLLNQLANYFKGNCQIDYAVNTILGYKGIIELEQVIHPLSIGERQFQRMFKQSVGLTAKQFQRLVRFESTVIQLMRNNYQDPLSIILRHGYYDQSHFYKDFRHFINSKPGDFLKERIYMSLYYNQTVDC